MTRLYVIGGQQRTERPLLGDTQYWYEYQNGLVLEVDTTTGQAETCLRYASPPTAAVAHNPEILFKSGTLVNDRLYLCTQTEVLIYALPQWEQVGYISLPCFNDVHHVRPTPAGTLLVANSGLDMVLELTHDGEIVRLWNTLGEEPWARFSPTIDYRKGVSTKPHRSHPNYVFQIGADVWATRLHQKDAVCLTRPDRRIPINIERVHDGVLHDGFVYFTTVNGNVVIVNPETLKIEDIIDLNTMHDGDTLIGWCRSIMIDNGKAWIGFSRIRPTKFRENVGWVMRGFKRVSPTHLGYYDLVNRRYLAEVNVEQHGLSAVFSIFPAVPQPQPFTHAEHGAAPLSTALKSI